MDRIYDIRVKLDEGYARPRWYTVADGLTPDQAVTFVSTYIGNDQGNTVVQLEVVARQGA